MPSWPGQTPASWTTASPSASLSQVTLVSINILNVLNFSGVFTPVSFLANTGIFLFSPSVSYRSVFCGLLIGTRQTITYVYSVTLIFNVLFRAMLILHAEKGLVLKGQTNLKLFNQLYWLTVCTFVLVGHIMLPLASILKGTFPSSAPSGQICLLNEEKTESEERLKIILIASAFIFLVTFFLCYLKWRVRRFISGICPKGTMACIGKYQRNVINFDQTSKWLYIWVFSTSTYVVSLKNLELSTWQTFLIWNTWAFVFNELLHCVVPLFLSVPKKTMSPIPFFITKPLIIEPRTEQHPCRRPSHKQRKLEDSSQIVENPENSDVIEVLKSKLILVAPAEEEFTFINI